MQVNYCSRELLVYGAAKCRVPKGSLGISLSEYRLAIRADGRAAEWIHSRAKLTGRTLLWRERGRGDSGEWWDGPWAVIVIIMHRKSNDAGRKMAMNTRDSFSDLSRSNRPARLNSEALEVGQFQSTLWHLWTRSTALLSGVSFWSPKCGKTSLSLTQLQGHAPF